MMHALEAEEGIKDDFDVGDAVNASALRRVLFRVPVSSLSLCIGASNCEACQAIFSISEYLRQSILARLEGTRLRTQHVNESLCGEMRKHWQVAKVCQVFRGGMNSDDHALDSAEIEGAIVESIELDEVMGSFMLEWLATLR